MKRYRVVQYGCGPIGCSVARYAAERRDLELVGAIDLDEKLVGKDLGEVAGLGRKIGVEIEGDADGTLARTSPDVVFITTSSALKSVYAQIEKCTRAGANVVSSCEELSYPYWAAPELSDKIDRLARDGGVTVLATGVNPGFIMDTWPLVMSGVCQQIEHVKVVRRQDASSRRCPFQKKIGAGCTPEEFKELAAAGTLRHVGLAESIAMIAAGLGWQLDSITDILEPIVAGRTIETVCVKVEPGNIAGVRQLGRGTFKGKELIVLEFLASVGDPNSYDAVYIKGKPNLEVTISGGAHGDIATTSMMVNAAYRVFEAPSGLKTMADLPVVVGPGVQ